MMLTIVENVSKARSMKRPNEEKLHSKEKIEVEIEESMEAIKKKKKKHHHQVTHYLSMALGP